MVTPEQQLIVSAQLRKRRELQSEAAGMDKAIEDLKTLDLLCKLIDKKLLTSESETINVRFDDLDQIAGGDGWRKHLIQDVLERYRSVGWIVVPTEGGWMPSLGGEGGWTSPYLEFSHQKTFPGRYEDTRRGTRWFWIMVGVVVVGLWWFVR